MQLVPRSGARDAYRFVYGEDRILPPDYLYVPDNNVELGCAYMGLLKNRYFRNVKRPENAQYCAVASYNTGVGNLSRALVGKPRIQPAVERINRMDPEELYGYLRKNLPYAETRDYIQKVRDRMSLYKEWE
jgi:membrane-bound lytic murein transglycosylase C